MIYHQKKINVASTVVLASLKLLLISVLALNPLVSNAASAEEVRLGKLLLKDNYKGVTQSYNSYLSWGPTSNTTTGGYHPGIDYRTAIGTPVYSPVSGNVVNVDRYGLGLLTIETEAGYNFMFLHLRDIHITSGRVTAGQRIGSSGEVGAEGQPHLHVEYRKSRKGPAFYFTYPGGGSENMDPLLVLSEQSKLELNYFWQSSENGQYQTSCGSDDLVIDAQFGVLNASGDLLRIDALAIALHNLDGQYVDDIGVEWNTVWLSPGERASLSPQFSTLNVTGEHSLLAKVNIDNEWITIGELDITITSSRCVTATPVSQLEMSNIVFEYIENSSPGYFPSGARTSPNGADSYYRDYGNSTLLLLWTDGNLYYMIEGDGWYYIGSLVEWYSEVRG